MKIRLDCSCEDCYCCESLIQRNFPPGVCMNLQLICKLFGSELWASRSEGKERRGLGWGVGVGDSILLHSFILQRHRQKERERVQE